MNRAFDVLNSRTKFGKGHSSAISVHNLHDVIDIYTEFSTYLQTLKNMDGVPLVMSRRKTFVVGMISTFHAIIQLSGELLTHSDYMLTFRFSQDHLETLFSKIRRMGGFNNNPPACHFKSALRRLLCVQSIRSSRSANVLDCESTVGVFKLGWSKRSAPMPMKDCDEDEVTRFELLVNEDNRYQIQDCILFYISGYIVRSLKGSVVCSSCSEAMLSTCCSHNDHAYFLKDAPSDSPELLLTLKNRGGLVMPSEGVYKLVKRCENIFKQTVVYDSSMVGKTNIKQFLVALFFRSVNEDRPAVYFSHSCPIEPGLLSHSQQLCKMIVSKFFDIRLKHFCKVYNRQKVMKGAGSDRQRLSRLVIFKHQ